MRNEAQIPGLARKWSLRVDHTSRPTRWIRGCRRLAIVVFLVFTGAGIGCYISYRKDCVRLQAKAEEVAPSNGSAVNRVISLLEWVHSNGRTSKNHHYFVFRFLGATPLQVLEHGGDCADKSRLLWAMLREVGIPATMAMCFDATSGAPGHTLVEAQVGPKTRMVVDPAYNLCFPKPGEAGYFGIRELRQDPSVVTNRVETLRNEVPNPEQPDRYYLMAQASYQTVSTFNWNKNGVTRSIHGVLGSFLGEDVYQLPRPSLIEEPKLIVAGLSLGFGSLSWLGLMLTTRVRARSVFV